MDSAIREGLYIYCLIGSSQPGEYGPIGIGDRGDMVFTVCYDQIAAVVSNSPIKKYAVSSDNARAHERAIEAVMKTQTVLPVRFCTIVEDEEKIIEILKREYAIFRDLLLKFQNKKELGFKAIFRQDIIYNDIVENYEDIRKLKEAVAKIPPAKAYYQLMKVGEMVEQALETEKEKYKDLILKLLQPLSEDIKINKPYGERMILNAAFLVTAEHEPEFDQKVQEIDQKYGSKLKLMYTGTLPPFNFVTLVIKIGKE